MTEESGATTTTAATTTNDHLALVAATRLHLGQASVAPDPQDLRTKIVNFASFCVKAQASVGVIAVDATPVLTAKLKHQQQEQQQHLIEKNEATTAAASSDDDESCPTAAVYNLMEAVQAICLEIDNDPSSKNNVALHVLPVTPWGKFVPALNALISFAATTTTTVTTSATSSSQKEGGEKKTQTIANSILFVSAETTLASKTALQSLLSHMDLETTLVVGARLPGHDYQHTITPAATEAEGDNNKEQSNSSTVVPLNGRTTPWNTLAVWNLRKLALTGFVQVSEGILTDAKTEPSQGVEEVMAISVLQNIFGPEMCKAKLVQLSSTDDGTSSDDGVLWEETFSDPQRQAWHDSKMKSKLERAARQVAMFPREMANAQVHHC